jgi:hypothetical protein
LIGAAAKGEVLLVLPCIDRLSGKSHAFCFSKSFLPPKARKRVILVRKPLLFILAAYSHLVVHHVGKGFPRGFQARMQKGRNLTDVTGVLVVTNANTLDDTIDTDCRHTQK